MSEILENREVALKLAERYAPKIYQEFGSFFDLIAPIQLSKLEYVIKDYAIVSSQPTLNFQVRDDEDYWYIYYMVYHCFDVSFSKLKLFRKLDSHRHDSESILLRVEKNTGRCDMITVSHYLFKGEANSNRRVVIERNGHGIHPYTEGGPSGNFLVYNIFGFFDLDSVPVKDWEDMRKIFDGVSMPDEQYDSRMSNGPQGRRHNLRGDIYNRPEVVFASMKLKGWI